MYENIGDSIRVIGVLTFWVEAIVAVIVGINLLRDGWHDTWIGIVVIFGGIVVALASSLILYGFGELIANSTSINQKLNK